MKSCYQFIEPLEPRIAPAILVQGGNLLGGKGNPTTGQTSAGGNTVTLITVVKGEALVFFNSATESITSISVGANTKLDITGNVIGDIVTNLLPDGQLTDSDHNAVNGENGGVLLASNFLGVTTHPLGTLQLGSIGGIIAGGSIKNVNVAGSLGGIYAGDGIFKTTTSGVVDVSTYGVNYNTVTPGLNTIMALHAAAAQSTATPSISNVTVGIADQLQVFAGDGQGAVNGLGNAGGSITGVTVTLSMTSDIDTPAIFLHAGNGAAEKGGTGGAGGSITQYTDLASNSYVKVETGNGGIAVGGTGGGGGSFTDSTISSNALKYEILVGNGGRGATGGNGGSINTISFSDTANGQAPLIATGDFNNDGIPDVLLINTITGNATLSEGTKTSSNPTEAPFQVVLQPSGSGGAASSTIAPEGSVPTDVVAADLTGNGKLDFVVSYSSSDNLGIFLNQGNGTFVASSVPLPASPTKITVGDYLVSGRPDIAVLTAGSQGSAGGALASQIYVAENNGAGVFSTVSAPETFTGVGTDLVSGLFNTSALDDLAVGLKSGFVDTFLATGSAAAPFTLAFSLSVFDGPISNLDVSGTTLLAFSINSQAYATPTPGTTTTAAAPFVQLLNVNATGGLTDGMSFIPAAALPSAAHFIGSSGVIGVVDPASVTIYEPVGGAYTPLASITSTGALTDFVTLVSGGSFDVYAVGASSSRFFETAGDTSDLSGVGTLLPFDIPGSAYVTNIQAGAGGAGGAHNGGAGGSITDLTFTQTVGTGVEHAGARFDLTFATGDGGTSKGGIGGAGGDMQGVALSLNPADYTGEQDSTTVAVLSTGYGGAGLIGGQGGNILNVTSNSIFDQINNGVVTPNSVALRLLAGNGGQGTGGAGGDGGSISLSAQPALSGVSVFDPDSSTPFAAGLVVQSGNGGNGFTSGGNGGDLVNIQTQNAAIGTDTALNVNELGSALITSGSGGTGAHGAGGNGGAITGLSVDVQSQTFAPPGEDYDLFLGGSLVVTSGSGGVAKGGLGGSGGAITKSTVASVDGDGFRGNDAGLFSVTSDPYYGVGVLVHGGAGANGTQGGGDGGSIQHLRINSPSDPDVYAAILMAGNGGQATHSGFGGDGGSITGVTQTKDVDSSLNVIQGGNAGTGIGGRGGDGGSVSDINTVGFIGLPATFAADLGVFNDSLDSPLIASLFAGSLIPQGVFAGRGAVGGISGSVLDVVAVQIAAIGAAENAHGIFAPAHSVDDITADLIGYQVKPRDGKFVSTVPGDSPAKAQPIDGFILANSVSDITTENKALTARFTFKG
jgi:hypothetical protein